MAIGSLKSGDTRFSIKNPRADAVRGVEHEPLQINGVAVDLTGCSVLMLLRLDVSPFTAYSLPASVDGAATNGDVIYEWEAGFPTVAGTYRHEWEVTFPDNSKLTFPNDKYNYIKILDDLN